MNRQFLKINDNKNEIMVFGNKKVLNSLHLNGTFLDSGVCIRFSDNVKHLDVWLDKSLTYTLLNYPQCVTLVLATSDLYEKTQLTESLVHSLNTCHTDMCNSLFFGTSKSNLHKLQVIQYTAIWVIFNLKKTGFSWLSPKIPTLVKYRKKGYIYILKKK